MNVGTLFYPSTKLVAIATAWAWLMIITELKIRRAISQNAELKTTFKGFYAYKATLYKPTVIKSSYAKWRYTRM